MIPLGIGTKGAAEIYVPKIQPRTCEPRWSEFLATYIMPSSFPLCKGSFPWEVRTLFMKLIVCKIFIISFIYDDNSISMYGMPDPRLIPSDDNNGDKVLLQAIYLRHPPGIPLRVHFVAILRRNKNTGYVSVSTTFGTHCVFRHFNRLLFCCPRVTEIIVIIWMPSQWTKLTTFSS